MEDETEYKRKARPPYEVSVFAGGKLIPIRTSDKKETYADIARIPARNAVQAATKGFRRAKLYVADDDFTHAVVNGKKVMVEDAGNDDDWYRVFWKTIRDLARWLPLKGKSRFVADAIQEKFEREKEEITQRRSKYQ